MYYFEDGLIKNETVDYVSGSGTFDWYEFDETIGTTGRKYFHVVVMLYLYYYDAEVLIDNFVVKDVNGDIEREIWKIGTDLIWPYVPLYRKEGWDFYPSFADPYFNVVYLGT
jgi:hypothetical protein